jgi:hypothetical protein
MRRKLRGPHDPEDNEASAAARIPVSRPTAVKPAASAQVTPIAEAASVRSATQAAAASATRTAAQAPANAAAKTTPTAKATPAATATPAAASPAAQQATPQNAQPPIENYDELSLASLRARLRGLDLAQVGQLLSYEKSHGSRSEVITMYERRIAKLREVGG